MCVPSTAPKHQYRSQPVNFVMLCKFKSLSLFISLEIYSLYGQKHRKIPICMTKCRTGFATAKHWGKPKREKNLLLMLALPVLKWEVFYQPGALIWLALRFLQSLTRQTQLSRKHLLQFSSFYHYPTNSTT